MADADNLKIQQQINKLLKERQSLLNSIEEQLSTQADTGQKFQDILAQASKLKLGDVFSKATEGAKNLKKSTKGAGDQAKLSADMIRSNMSAAATSSSGLSSVLGGIGSAFKNVGKGAMAFGGVAMAAASLATGAFSSVLSIISSVAGFIKSVVSNMWNLAKSIIALPFDLLNGLIKIGNDLMGVGLDIARAWEDVREVFGDLSTSVGADIRSTVMNLRMIGDTGLDAYQVLGTMSQRIESVSKLYQGLGGAVMLFSREIKNSNGAVIAFQRGLGFTEEQLQGVATVAMSSGKSLVEVQAEIANQAIQLGETFGIPKKLIGKDVAEMINDIDTFGNMTVKQMAKTSVYAKKLGVDVKKMAGVFKAFSNFEDAAIGAAKLSQAFGMNIDAVKQLKAGSPAEIIEDLRSAFFAAGKDAANLNRHELALLATQTGLDQETAKRVFSLENQGIAYEDIANKADDAESAQLTAANAMKQVAKDIKRIVHEVLKMDGAFAEFRKGFEQGFTIMNPKFMNLVKIARDVGFTMRGMGQQFAKAILQLEPVQNVFDGLADFMKGFTGLLKNVAKEFVVWAKGLGTNAGKAGEQLVNRLSNVFNNFMNNPRVAEGLKKIKNGISGIATIVLETLSGLIPQAIKKFRELLDKGTEYLKNPDKLNISAAAPQWVKSLMKLFEGVKAQGGPLIDSIKSFFGELFKGDFLDKMGITDMVTSLANKMMVGIFRAIGKTDLPFADKFSDAADEIENDEKRRADAKRERENALHKIRLAQIKRVEALEAVHAKNVSAVKSKELGNLKTKFKEQLKLRNVGIEMRDISLETIKNAKGEVVGQRAMLNFNKENKKHALMMSEMRQKGIISAKEYHKFLKDGSLSKNMSSEFRKTAAAATKGASAVAGARAGAKKAGDQGAMDAKQLAKLEGQLSKAEAAGDALAEQNASLFTFGGAGKIKILGAKIGFNSARLKELNDLADQADPIAEKIKALRKKMGLGTDDIQNVAYYRPETLQAGKQLGEVAGAVADGAVQVKQKTDNLNKAFVELDKAIAPMPKVTAKVGTLLKPLEKKGLIGKEGKLVIQRKDQPINVHFDIVMDAKDIKKIVNEDNVKNKGDGGG